MHTCTRADFQAAIDEGLNAAGSETPNEAAILLREFGRTATRVGVNFETGCGCPLAATGLYVVGLPPWQRTFVSHYDNYLIEHTDAYEGDYDGDTEFAVED